ncbi:acetyltransferase [Thomasclavelia sp.]
MKNLLIWGAGDQGLVTLDCALAMQKYTKIDFLDFKEKGHREIKNYTIYEESKIDLNTIFHLYDEVIVATGSNDLRKEKISLLKTLNIPIATIIHPTAIISSFAQVSAGCTILANAVININAIIGKGCIINTAAIVEHDCIVEEFVNICPNVTMAGHVKVGRKSFIGTGASLIDEIEIGKETIIGAGTVVVKDIPDHVTAVGVPARVIKNNKV